MITTITEALRSALREEMIRDPRVIVLGEDVGVFNGAYQVTRGLQEEFGESRVRDTPISEIAIIGAAIGAAVTGMRPVAEIQFNDFLTCCMDQLVNQAAKMHLMFGGQASVPMVVRAPYGATGRAAQHSQSLEAWFVHAPGLKVVMPATPYDAKGLLKTAIRDNNPVIFLEHKLLYGGTSPGGKAKSAVDSLGNSFQPAPEEEYTVPFGQAVIRRAGSDVTVVATGLMSHKSLEAAEILAQEGISLEVIDPRTLAPLDLNAILASVKKTGRLVVVSEDALSCGITAEIAALVSEHAWDDLDAPVKRVAARDCPIPFAAAAESYVLPSVQSIIDAVQALEL